MSSTTPIFETLPDTRPQFIKDADAREKGPRFLGVPERWLDDMHFRCENGHVSTRVLKSEQFGRDLCLACHGRLWLTFPEDMDDADCEERAKHFVSPYRCS